MVGGLHQLDRHEFEQALGVGDGQGIPVCCSPWGHQESGKTTERLNNKDVVCTRITWDFVENADCGKWDLQNRICGGALLSAFNKLPW